MSMNMSGQKTLQPLPRVPVNTSVNTTVNKKENLDGPQRSSTPSITVREKTLERTLCRGDAGNTTDMAVTGDETETGSADDMTACQVHKPSSSLPQGVAGPSAHSTTKPVTDALQKRELRLMKNREAARECRRKKKEYVKCLENRVAVLENQNKTLIEELRTLKDIYRHKVE
ncbi:hypothetical protein INR49_021086 [Caranx melampygus]|nr:hypothetical protein INR49_021086 [Caranx melampygus]